MYAIRSYYECAGAAGSSRRTRPHPGIEGDPGAPAPAERRDAMSEDAALALLRLLAQEGECSQPRAAKRLGLGASELQRLMVALGDSYNFV